LLLLAHIGYTTGAVRISQKFALRRPLDYRLVVLMAILAHLHCQPPLRTGIHHHHHQQALRAAGPGLLGATRRVTLLTRRTNCWVSSVLASARTSAGERSCGTARSFSLGGTLPPSGERERAFRCRSGAADTDSENWRRLTQRGNRPAPQ